MSHACVICGSDDVVLFLDRPRVPVHQNLPRTDAALARTVTRGNLRLGCCRRCGFIGNLAFREELLEYGENYDNDQNWSPRFDAHVDAYIARLIEGGVRDKDVIEVGCGKGTFLRRLCERGDNRGIGFDPSYVGPLEVDGGRVRFVREMYGGPQRHIHADVIVCRHVIEHVPRPLDLLAEVRRALSGPARLHFETPDVSWILRGVVIQDFFYEHCSYFTPESLAETFVRAGFVDTRVERVFGDQYLWLEASHEPASAAPPTQPRSTASVADAALRYMAEERGRLERVSAALRRMRAEGAVAVWGAGAKGVTFLNLLDPQGSIVDCVVDINPRKQGLFLPGTGHPIVGPDVLGDRKIANAIVMNGNYMNEIRAGVERAGLTIRIHDEADL